MGAEFQFDRIEQTERQAVKAAFDALQDEAAHRRGHEYSGEFNMANGLEFRDDQAFTDRDDAYEWLSDNARKWEAALAVRHVDQDGKHIGYFVGASCAC